MDTVTRTRGDGRSSDLMTHYIKDKNTKKEFKDKLKKLQQENQMLLTTHRIKFANMTAERDKLKEKIEKSEQDFLDLKRDNDQRIMTNGTLKRDIVKLNISLKKLKNENSKNLEIIKKLKKDNKHCKLRRIQANKEKEKCVLKVESLLKERKKLEDDNTALLDAKNCSQSIIENLETQKEISEKDLKTKDGKIATLENRNMKLSLQVLSMKKKFDDAKCESEIQKDTQNKLREEKQELEKEVSVQGTIMKNLHLQIEDQATTMAAMREEINYKKKKISVAFQRSRVLDESLKKSHLTNQNVLKALVERDILIGKRLLFVLSVLIIICLIEKLDEDRAGTYQNKAMGTGAMLRRFNKLRTELEVLRRQQRSIVRNGRYISGILQYSKTLLNQAGKEVAGETSTYIIEQLQLPLSSLV